MGCGRGGAVSIVTCLEVENSRGERAVKRTKKDHSVCVARTKRRVIVLQVGAYRGSCASYHIIGRCVTAATTTAVGCRRFAVIVHLFYDQEVLYCVPGAIEIRKSTLAKQRGWVTLMQLPVLL